MPSRSTAHGENTGARSLHLPITRPIWQPSLARSPGLLCCQASGILLRLPRWGVEWAGLSTGPEARGSSGYPLKGYQELFWIIVYCHLGSVRVGVVPWVMGDAFLVETELWGVAASISSATHCNNYCWWTTICSNSCCCLPCRCVYESASHCSS